MSGIFGAKQQKNRPDVRMGPGLPAIVRTPLPTTPGDLHPAALEMASSYHHALDDVRRLEAELAEVRRDTNETIRQLAADLEVERRHVLQLEKMLREERAQMEDYRRYAITIRHHLEQVAASAVKANDVAMQVHGSEEVREASRKVADAAGKAAVEAELGEQGATGHPDHDGKEA